MKKILNEKAILIIAGILILLGFLFSTYTAVKSFTLKPGEEAVIAGGATVKKPTNNIVDASLDDQGYLVVKFEDGTSKEIGYILGQKGDKGDSIAPTQAQIALAVTDYCNNGNRCDAKSPTPEQVAAAVSSYCSTRNDCAGSSGKDGTNGSNGQNTTDAQVMAAVANYCSDGRCKGPQGPTGAQGATGASGSTPVLACVSRQEQNQITGLNETKFYVAWGYKQGSNAAADWNLLYKINSNDAYKPCTAIS